jgi:NAD(P)H-dependent flavin oxidoreductase YrpB (nitropropane dioxygenase family)
MQGAQGVWVGTRFVASVESGAPKSHKEAIVTAGWNDTLRTLVISGRPLRVRMNDYLQTWENQPEKVKQMTDKGVIPFMQDLEEGNDVDLPHLMGQVAALVNDVKPAQEIVDDMVAEAIKMLELGHTYLSKL